MPTLSRRSIPSHVLDDHAFPVRIKLRVPEVGLGPVLLEILRWLRSDVGENNFACHDADVLYEDALALHFCRLEDATAFLLAFPKLKLADDTTSRAYQLSKVPRRLAG